MRAAIPHSRFPIADSRGFTLLEILIVVVILAVLTAIVTLAVSGAGGERQLEREAERVRTLIVYACEQAELTGREIGFNASADGYHFSRYDHDVWLPIKGSELRERKWPQQTIATLTRDTHPADDEKTPTEKPQLICFDSGELTAFRLELALPDVERRYRIDGHLDGTVDMAAVMPRAR
jgi:general secretion pathway protein H